jgi:acid phosphatase type 7
MRRPVSFPALVVVAGVSALVSAAAGFAAALVIAPERLTVFTAPSTVPISTCTLTAAADTYADEGSSGSNFGTQTTLHVRSGTTFLVLPANKRSFARFNLSSCSIPANARVETASMRLFLSTAPAVSRTYQAHRLTASWNETALNWGNQPTAAAAATASAATGVLPNVTLAWDVVADVRSFVAGTATNNGWRINDSVESDTGEGRFSAREHATAAQRPTLVVTYYP